MRDNGSPPPELSKRRTRRRSRPWSLAEQEVLVREHRKLGNAWASIKNSLPNRSTTEIKNAWYSSLRCKQPGIRSLLRSYVRAVQQFGEDPEARERAYNLAYDSIKHLDNSALSSAVDFDCWDEPEGDEPAQERNPTHPLPGSGPSSSTDVKAPPAFHTRDTHLSAAVSAARSSPMHPSRLQRQQSLPGALAGGSAGSSPRVPPSAPNHSVLGSSGCNPASLCHPLSRSPDVQLHGRPNLLKEHAPDGAASTDHPASGLTATLMARLLLAQQGVREGVSVSTIEQPCNTAREACEPQDGPEGAVLMQLGAGGCSGGANGDAISSRTVQRRLQPPSQSRQMPRLPVNMPPANEIGDGPLKLQAWWYDESTGVITGAAGVEELKLALLATLSSAQQHEQEQPRGQQLHRDAMPQAFERPAAHEQKQQQTYASLDRSHGGDSLAGGSRQGHWKQRFRAGSGGAQAELFASNGPAASAAHLPGPAALGPWGSGALGTCSLKVGPSHSSPAMPHFASEPPSFTRSSHPRSQGKRLSDDHAFADGGVGVTGRGHGPPGRRLSSLPLQHHGLGQGLGLGGALERQDSHGAGADAADGEEHSTHEIAAFLDAQRRQRLREESIQSPAPAVHGLPGGSGSCLRPEDSRPPAAKHLPRWSSVPGLAPSLDEHDAVGRAVLRNQRPSLVDQDDAPGPGGRLQPYGTSGQAALLLQQQQQQQQQRAASLGAELQRLAEAGLLSGPTLSRLASSLGSGMAGDGGGFSGAGGGSGSGSLLRGGSGDREEGLDLGPVSAGSTSSVASAQAGGGSGPMQWEGGASAGGGGIGENLLGGRVGAAGRMLAGVGGVALVQRAVGAGVLGGVRDPLALEAARRLQQQQWERERELQLELLQRELRLREARGQEVKEELDVGTSMDVDGHGDEVAGRGHLQADAAVSATLPTRLAAALDLTRNGNAGALEVLRSLSGAGVDRW